MVYRDFCKFKYGCVIDCFFLFDIVIEDVVCNRCRKIWNECYKDEFFDIVLNLWGSIEDIILVFLVEEFFVLEILELVVVIIR